MKIKVSQIHKSFYIKSLKVTMLEKKLEEQKLYMM